MKKAFTLVELLIVVAILVTLMTITFRLSSVGGDTTKRNKTIMRLNRIENCLSGYYAAFGSYPPVKLHGTRDIYARISSHGIQSLDENDRKEDIWGWYTDGGNHGIGSTREVEAWEQVKAACQSQPFDARFPFPGGQAYGHFIEAFSDSIQQRAADNKGISEQRKRILTAPFDNGVSKNVGRFNPYKNMSDWRDVQIFKFGLMSYLLPRYLLMMNTEQSFFNQVGDGRCQFAQWGDNNNLPCDPMTGEELGNNGWHRIHDWVNKQYTNPKDYAKAKNIPSQAVTARWLPNLAGMVCTHHDLKLYGVDLKSGGDQTELSLDRYSDMQIFSPGGFDDDSTSNQYVLDSATVLDGWWHELYYYSPPPYQTYTVWSAGPNNRTFPPWISRKTLTSQQNRCVSLWVEDDIVRMSN